MRTLFTRVVAPSIAVLISGAPFQCASAAVDPWSEGQTFQAVFPEANGGFGSSISIDGDVMAIGQPRASAMGVDGAGSVEIWRRNGTWSREATIFAAQPLADAHFGTSISIQGNNLNTGEPDRGNGTTRLKAGMIQLTQRNPSTGLWANVSTFFGEESNENLGIAMAQQGNLLAYSGPGSTTYLGGYVIVAYADDDPDPNYLRIVDPQATAGDSFGKSLAIYRSQDASFADLLVVGAPSAENDSGIVYVYANSDHTGAVWTKVATLGATNPLAHERFGASVATGRNRVIVGTPNRTKQGATPVSGAGSVAVFVPNGAGGWVLQNEVFLTQPGAGDGLGASVAYEPVSDRIFSGAPGRMINLFGGPGSAGAVEVFQYEKITGPFFAWKNTAEVSTLEQPSAAQSGGAAIAVDQGTLYMGAPDYDDSGAHANSGRVVMFVGDAIFANAFEAP